MDQDQFERQAAKRFPSIADVIEEYSGLLHTIFGFLYGYVQENIQAGEWAEVDRVFRFIEDSFRDFQPVMAYENAVRVSFLEYFDFGSNEDKIRELFGTYLAHLYDDQMAYMKKLEESISGN